MHYSTDSNIDLKYISSLPPIIGKSTLTQDISACLKGKVIINFNKTRLLNLKTAYKSLIIIDESLSMNYILNPNLFLIQRLKLKISLNIKALSIRFKNNKVYKFVISINGKQKVRKSPYFIS